MAEAMTVAGFGGLPVKAVARWFIVERVKDKLIGGNSISQVAYDLGFEYPQHLSRLFKKQEGCMPTAYFNIIHK